MRARNPAGFSNFAADNIDDMTDFRDISYLRGGNPRQRAAFEALTRLRVMESLAAYDPLLTGTIPIGIDIPGSDLDIICCVPDAEAFINEVTCEFSGCDGFSLRRDGGVVVASFHSSGFEIEVFGQDVPTHRQNAYRHMLVEHAVLQERGEDFRRQVVELKMRGMKTEPAFALLLGLDGDPYQTMLALEDKYDLN